MKRLFILVASLVLCISFVGTTNAYVVYTTDDWGYAGGEVYGNATDFICERDFYEAYFTFDLSSVPESMVGSLMTFNASIHIWSGNDGNRTVWDASTDTLLGAEYFASNSTYTYETISIGTWAGDDSLTLILTGPADFTHLCARVEMLESGNRAYLAIGVPEPSTFLLLGAGLAGVGLLRRKFK